MIDLAYRKDDGTILYQRTDTLDIYLDVEGVARMFPDVPESTIAIWYNVDTDRVDAKRYIVQTDAQGEPLAIIPNPNYVPQSVQERQSLFANNYLTVNHGEIGAGVNRGTAGMIIDRGTLPDAKIYFDENEDVWKIAIGDDIQTIGTGTSASEVVSGVDATTVAQHDVYTVPDGYVFLADAYEVITETISGASDMPIVQFGLSTDTDAIIPPEQLDSSMNEVNARQRWNNPYDALSAGTVIQFGITTIGASTSHTLKVLVRGTLIKL